MFKRLIISILLATSGLAVNAQFTVTGSTTSSSCGFTVTPDTPNQTGSFYQNATVSLATDFSLLFSVNFGCSGTGASGLCFVFQDSPWNVGGGSYGMGYSGMTGNSLAVEFDTYDNSGGLGNWDIGADHIGLFTGGSNDHNPANPLNLMGAVPTEIIPGNAEAEDCDDHLVEIIWDYINATSQTISVIVDGTPSLTKTGNFINLQFAGNPNVLWGWTGSTGPQSNLQTVDIALEPNFTISATNCPGQLINFTDASVAQNTITNWLWDFDGLGTSTLQNPSFTFVTAGSHDVTLTITDNTGCTNSITIPVGVGFEVDPTADNMTICPNTSTVLHANAAPYVGNTCCFDLVLGDIWDDGWAGNNVEVFVNGVSTGTYSPPAMGNGLPYYHTFNLCFDHDDVVEIQINGAAYPNECTYTLYDAGGATILTVAAGPGTWVNGSSQSFTVNCGMAPPAYTYSWDNSIYLGGGSNSADPTATIPSTTTFTVTVTDPGTGCSISDNVTVSTYPPVTATISGNQTICNGNSANLQINFTGTPPFDVTVSGPGGPYVLTGIMPLIYNFSASQNGSYTISSVSGSGCTGTFSGTGTITVITPPNVDIGATASYCDGDPISPLTVISGGAGTVNWYNNSGLVGPPLGTGMSYTPVQGVGSVTYYAATTEPILGCVGAADNVTITVNPIPAAPAFSGNTTYCDGDTPTPLTGIPTLGGTITWYADPGLTTVLSTLTSYNPGLVVGTTTIYITETANGCEGPSTPISILVKPTPTAPAVTGDMLYCEGESPTALTATPTLGGTIAWENSLGVNVGSGTTFTPPLTNGFSNFTATETLNGCTGPETTITIEVQPAPMVSVTEQVSICIGDSIEITALNNGYTITWSDSQSGETVWLGPDTTTMIYVTATNPLCGFAMDSILVTVNYLPEVVAGNDTLIGIGGEVELWAESDPDVTYSWIPEPSECLNDDCSEIYDVPDQATLYVVIVTDPIGCQNSDSVLVDINGYMEVFVPNIFSPNGDGHNDYLVINGPRLFNYYIQIYDRWGKVVFESNEQKEYWDGKLNGSDLAPQTFVYMLSGESVLGDKIVQEGNVTIIK
ncbi:MAG: gliding motility-associated C-terminal domain-containing protein [Crocinitomicaceae bacterium]|nr:gliding motility-associated C-terminal domain-containing protein [Crocinitomicaceae bacterium]